MSRAIGVFFLATLAIMGASTVAAAQIPPMEPLTDTASTAWVAAPDTLASRDDKAAALRVPLITKREQQVAAGFGVATALLMKFDESITHAFMGPRAQRSQTLKVGRQIFDAWGAPIAMIAGPTALAAGLALNDSVIAHVGLHTTETFVATAGVVYVLKAVLGRARPSTVQDSTSWDYSLGRGYPHVHNYVSMPSGHTAASFALASSLSAEARRWWPAHATRLTIALYSAAALDGLSRIYGDNHWASDVALGAGIGTVMGMVVVRRQHAHPHNVLDRLANAVLVMPGGDGRMTLGVTAAF